MATETLNKDPSEPGIDERRVVLGVTSSNSLKLVVPLGEELADRGWQVHIVSGPTVPGSNAGVRFHEVPMQRDWAILHDLRAFVAWVKILRAVRPTVVMYGTPKAALLASGAGLLAGVPRRVYHVRGLRLETTRGLQRAALWTAERATVASSTHVLAVSPSLASRLEQLKISRRGRVAVIGSGSSKGVDGHRFGLITPSERTDARVRLGLSLDLPVVGFVGRMGHDKGVDVLLDALQITQSSGCEFQALFVGRDEGFDWQRAGRKWVLMNDVVRRLPYSSNMVEVYAAMDLLCLPSLREGFPNVVLEAAARGLPSVVSDRTGCIDATEHGVTGFIASVEGPHDLAEKIQSLLKNPSQGIRMGQAARNWVLQNFSEREVLAGHCRFLEALLPQVIDRGV